MMGAFGQLAAADTVKPSELAGNINVALITTAVGLMIAIPLMMVVSALNLRIKQLEDLTQAGLSRFFETYKAVSSTVFRWPLTRSPGIRTTAESIEGESSVASRDY
jgi:biopolymer transport protein ExbB/TolQ